jgi:ParB family chromosome partitioning protein
VKSQSIPIEKVVIPEVRVTSYFDQGVYEEFRRTVAKVGVIEPIIVMERPDGFYLIDGFNRLAEAKAKGDTELQAVVMEGDERDIFLTNLFLNVMRGKTKVVEMRQVIEFLVKTYRMKVDQIATRTGLTRQYILDLLTICSLPEDIIAAFDAGSLSKGAALALADLSPAELQLRVFAQIVGRNVSVADVEAIVALIREENREVPPPPPRESGEPAPAGKEVECDLCHKPYELKWLRSVLVCSDCEVEHADILGTAREGKA